MKEQLKKKEVFSQLPAFIGEWDDSFPTSDKSIIVLDDDPTGTQTVNDVPVLTSWKTEDIERELMNDTPLFYILTNSRSLNESETTALHQQLAKNILLASKSASKAVQIISRSDSTLRGHFPLEPEVLGKELFETSYLTILIPAFFEGGRYTFNNIHYVEEDEYLIPAAETPFARDATFGYQSSNLYDWVCEKNPSITTEDIFDLSINELRTSSQDEITQKILDNTQKKVLIVNACEYQDLERFCISFNHATQKKQFNYLFRTAASIVPVIGQIARKPILDGEEITGTDNGGLVVVGSYVPKTNKQLSVLLNQSNIYQVELSAAKLLNKESGNEEIERVTNQINLHLKSGEDVVVFTSRELITGKDKNESLDIINKISSGVVQVIGQLAEQPNFLIAKGGITSSDIATKSLRIRRAIILGQIHPGIPVWEAGKESRFPGMPYIVFPGNVGNDEALLKVYQKLTSNKTKA